MPDLSDARPDANLIVALDALLQEHSVAGAAARLRVGESAVYTSLRKLRSITGDRLLVRAAGGSALTPAAQELRPFVQDAMRSIGRALEGGRHFDPRHSNRTFWISASGYTQARIGAALVRLIRRNAPGVRIRMTSLDTDGFTLDSLFRRDVVLAHVGSQVTGMRKILFKDELVVIVASGNPRLRDGALDTSAIGSMRLVLGTGGQSIPHPVASMFEGVAPLPSIGLNVVGDDAIPSVVAQGDFMGVVPRRLVRPSAQQLGVVIAETPLRPVQIVEAAHWHPSKRADPAMAWLVGILENAVTASGLTG